MNMLKWLLLPAAIALLAIGAVACNGDENGDDTDGDEPTTEATQPADGGEDGGGDSELSGIVDDFESATFRATYNFTSSGEDALSGEMVLYKRGADQFRFDVTDEGGETGSLSFIETAESTLLCLSDPAELGPVLGIEEGQGVCLETDAGAGANPVAGLSGIFSDIEEADESIVDESERTIAGQEAQCFTAEGDGGATEEFCFGDDGILLYFKSEGPGDQTVEMEAQSVSGDVSADAFEPPFEVREFPGIGDAQ